MKIRSITYFLDPGWPLQELKLRRAGDFLTRAKSRFESAGVEIQTTRIATIPFPALLGKDLEQAAHLAQDMSRMLKEIHVEYASLGPALINSPRSYAVIPEALSESDNIFWGGEIANRNDGISLDAVNACAEIIRNVSTITPDGFANLRFAALANVDPGSPFFPAAYWADAQPAFAIAVESADLAVEAFDQQMDLEAGRRSLTAAIEKHGRMISKIAETDLSDARFIGIDFSLAPFPDDAHSLGNAVEKMGVEAIGLHGSLAAAAILTEAVERADFPRTGFSGFMQPILEDSVLAKRAAEGSLTIKDALLYSAVCGTGLDTIPLPGDATAGQIAPLLLDLSALALRLGKPLTARLMPIPGKMSGDATNFDFGFFSNSKIMSLESRPLYGSLKGSGTFRLEIRRTNK